MEGTLGKSLSTGHTLSQCGIDFQRCVNSIKSRAGDTTQQLKDGLVGCQFDINLDCLGR